MTLPAGLEGGSRKPTNLPWLTGYELDGLVDTAGGYCMPFTAGTTLFVGDVVFQSAAHTVNKSAVAADYTTGTIGVVVGGQALNREVFQSDMDVGEVAGTVGQTVMVCILGKCKVVSDAAITQGAILSGGVTTAGRALTTAGGRLKAMEAAAGAGVKILVLVR